MKSILKILISCFVLFSLNCVGQKDSIKKQQVFLSFNIGAPLYNQFTYKIDEDSEILTAISKPRPSFNFNFEHNINHFTINGLYTYSQNEFIGNSFIINGKSLGTAPHSATVYKHLEVYQKIKYNYLQIGLGIGYNHWIKKHNISLTTNIHQNVFSKIIVDVYYVENSPYNDQDTTAIKLARNLPVKFSAFDNLAFSASVKLMYTYKLNEKIFLSFSTDFSAAFNNMSLDNISSYSGGTTLAYRISYQETMYANIGIRYKLF